MSNTTSDTIKTIKRPPGRPTNKKKSNIPFYGIVDTPENICIEYPEYSNSMELLYNNPTMFKKIFKLYKKYNASEILIRFTLTEINIFAVSHTFKNIIYATIIGSKMNRYYCEKPFEISIDVPKFFRLMNSINGGHGYILFESVKSSYAEKISISLKDTDTSEKSTITLELNTSIIYPWDIITTMIDKEQYYPIEFCMPHKKWKEKVSAWLDTGNQIRIEKIGYEPLTITCGYSDNRGGYTSTFENCKDIKLKSELEEMDIFSIGINLQFISGQSTSLVGDDVIIRISKEDPIIFTSNLDVDTTRMNGKKIKMNGSERAYVKVLTCIEKNIDETISDELYDMILQSQQV